VPIYVYECKECEAEMEVIQKIADPPPEACEKCEAKGTLNRKLGVSNFQLKGDGWAKDGYSS